MPTLNKGYVQIYTGNGKGKTTAAVGLGVRAAGDGFNVYMVQFLKGGSTGELNSIKKLEPNFKLFRFEKPRGFFWTLTNEEKEELKNEIGEAFNFCYTAAKEKKCDVLIMDEIMGAISNKLVTEDDVIELINNKDENVEIILTGRNVPEKLAGNANLITEMKDIKHYFNEGVPARKGIEY